MLGPALVRTYVNVICWPCAGEKVLGVTFIPRSAEPWVGEAGARVAQTDRNTNRKSGQKTLVFIAGVC